MSRRLKTLAMALILFLTMMFAGKCAAQSRQFQVERICPTRFHCVSQHRAYIAVISDSVVFIRSDSIPVIKYSVIKHFRHKGVEYFHVKADKIVQGMVVLTEHYAVLDATVFVDPDLIRRFDIYHFKK